MSAQGPMAAMLLLASLMVALEKVEGEIKKSQFIVLVPIFNGRGKLSCFDFLMPIPFFTLPMLQIQTYHIHQCLAILDPN